MSGELDGKVALVTGGGSGIGHAIAQRFGREGASVVINYYGSEDQAEALAEKISQTGCKSLAVGADVSDRAAVQSMVDRAVAEFGRIDVLVNNAGIEISEPFLDIKEENWDKVLHTDLKGAFLCAQACGRVMRDSGGGAIVNISSVHEDLPFPGYVSYCVAKGGMRMLMRAAAPELAQYNIRMNNVAPGAIATPINQKTLSDPKKVELLERVVPLRRVGTPEEVAEVVLFLASERSAYVTGSTYFVDGGLIGHSEPV